MEARLGAPVTDDLRLLALAPYVTEPLARALGVESQNGATPDLLDRLQSAGVVWPGTTRALLAEPIRERWFQEITAKQPSRVSAARLRLLEHLVSNGESLLATRLAADARQWTTLAGILRRSGSEVWARSADGFSRALARLRSSASSAPVVVEALLSLDPETAVSAETPSLVASALNRLPDVSSVTAGRPDALIIRVSLLRAAGRFALASEASDMLADALGRARDLKLETKAEGWYQVAMTFLAMGQLRAAPSPSSLCSKVTCAPREHSSRRSARTPGWRLPGVKASDWRPRGSSSRPAKRKRRARSSTPCLPPPRLASCGPTRRRPTS
jgi:LuxR family maltose regulon positive regulatory protein